MNLINALAFESQTKMSDAASNNSYVHTNDLVKLRLGRDLRPEEGESITSIGVISGAHLDEIRKIAANSTNIAADYIHFLFAEELKCFTPSFLHMVIGAGMPILDFENYVERRKNQTPPK